MTQDNSATPEGVRQGAYRCLLSAVVHAAQNPDFRAALDGASAAIRIQVSRTSKFCCVRVPTCCLVSLNTKPTYGVQALLDAGTFRTDDARSEAVAALKAVGGSTAR